MTVEIIRVDPSDDAAVDAWWNAYAAAERADRGEQATVWSREERRSDLQHTSTIVEHHAFVLRAGGQIVGSATLALPLKDNVHVAHVTVSVPAEHRRQGFGTKALAALEAQAVAAGRRTAQSNASWPHALGQDGIGAPGREFARSHGYALALGDVQNRLALPLDPAALDLIGDEIENAVAGYELRSWVGPVPDDMIERWAALDASIDTEAPTGELDVEPTKPDVASIRDFEALMVRQSRTSFGTIALTGEGEAAAYSQLVMSSADGNAYQWGTLVRRADRGHRLGTAVKIANLRMLQSEAPHAHAVYTYNAESNSHMLAVNALLGFVPTERMGELQKHLL